MKRNQSENLSIEQKICLLFKQDCKLYNSPNFGIFVEIPPGTPAATINQYANLIKSAGITIEVTQEHKIATLIYPGKLRVQGETIDTFSAKITALLEHTSKQSNIENPQI
ncbi:hypothetical protein B1207_04840 [Legionella quinlivanii]|uniref:Uncharacterized protein n=1 Tax=Legionella quinlivanii TaxID=45073 RepID=A0A364LL99_9GAMM|nr:hypothetical protein [Legionella quinlivanii]RAP37504.1 hypothetical protein B1207_04840 [Legionella quinlivanii]